MQRRTLAAPGVGSADRGSGPRRRPIDSSLRTRLAPSPAGRPAPPMPRPTGGRRIGVLLAILVALPVALAGCVPQPAAGSLQPTLTMSTVGASTIAYQDGIPVPTFDPQTRPRLDLSGKWRVQRAVFDSDVTLTDRRQSLKQIEADAAGRQTATYDDSDWDRIAVPGAVNPPPDQVGGSAWYRLHFAIPADWAGRALTLKFGAANYVADVWLNGRYLGYHEGGFTPFAFDATSAAIPGEENLLAVRVDTPEWGSRDDIVPWGLADWWNYGGITQAVWLEASTPMLIDRADVVPHLDGADVTVTLERRAMPGEPSDASTTGDVVVDIMPARIDAANLVDLDPRHLVPVPATSLGSKDFSNVSLGSGAATTLQASFAISNGAQWTIGHPVLYLLRVTLLTRAGEVDQVYETFGLRHVAVDKEAPRILLNGTPTVFSGASVHDEVMSTSAAIGATKAEPMTTAEQALAQIRRAQRVNVNLLRTAHQPGVPQLLMLADRLGIAVWEEIPLYHFTPRTFDITLGRGIPQQMLREMALRDMNRASVLFYGLANESTGGGERSSAMGQLNQVARDVDGTRLTGQAMYGFDPSDGTSDALDVAGYTLYYGVFYGSNMAADTANALEAAHKRYPTKPIMALEFGRWSDPPGGQAAQEQVFQTTQAQLALQSAARKGGYVAASVWWALDDYYTMRPGITVERFGMFTPAGRTRLVAGAAQVLFGLSAPHPVQTAPVDHTPFEAAKPIEGSGSFRLAAYLAYGIGMSLGLLGAILGLFWLRHGRWGRTRRGAFR